MLDYKGLFDTELEGTVKYHATGTALGITYYLGLICFPGQAIIGIRLKLRNTEKDGLRKRITWHSFYGLPPYRRAGR